MAPFAVDDIIATSSSPEHSATKAETEVTGRDVRLAARSGSFTKQTSGVASTYVQANLIALPSRYASDFRLLCKRNPVPCPLLAESREVGRWDQLKSWLEGLNGDQIAGDVDVRHDCPRYMVYQDGVLMTHCENVEDDWSEDHVAFLIGCSFSFEKALCAADLVPAHLKHGRNVSMYRTKVPLCPAGVFTHAPYVVSMRAYRKRDIGRVRDITRTYVATHGEPIDWGWDAVGRLGILDLGSPDYGDSPVAPDGSALREDLVAGDDQFVPVFWGCGVTPQEAVRTAQLKGTVIGHAPGHMMVLDLRDWDIARPPTR